MRRALLITAVATGLMGADFLERDPLIQPFASTSIGNTPIGSGAVYFAAHLPGVPGGNPPGKPVAGILAAVCRIRKEAAYTSVPGDACGPAVTTALEKPCLHAAQELLR